jgi:hypothetical protein
MHMNTKLFVLCLAVGICCAIPGPCWAGEDQVTPAASQPLEVELFAAVKSGQLQVVTVPHNYSVMTMRVRNNTRQALKVSLPKAFAAIPTARWQTQQALQRQGRVPSLGDGYIIDPNGSQGLAGSLAGPWVYGAPFGAPGGVNKPAGDPDAPLWWTLAAGQQIQIQVPCFCIEFGKPDPNRRIPYQMVELRDLNNRPVIQELLDRFSRGGLDQRIAQLAAWHVANGVPWHMLAQIKLPRSNGRGGGSVSPQELLAARQLSESLPSYYQQPSLGNRQLLGDPR